MIRLLPMFLAINFSGYGQDMDGAVVEFSSVSSKNDVCTSVEIPRSFSPNEDGINDLLRISSIIEVSNFGLTVYNNWGEVVYQTSNLHFTWDGTSGVANEKLPTGDYLYLCSYECQGDKYSLSGDVTLLR